MESLLTRNRSTPSWACQRKTSGTVTWRCLSIDMNCYNCRAELEHVAMIVLQLSSMSTLLDAILWMRLVDWPSLAFHLVLRNPQLSQDSTTCLSEISRTVPGFLRGQSLVVSELFRIFPDPFMIHSCTSYRCKVRKNGRKSGKTAKVSDGLFPVWSCNIDWSLQRQCAEIVSSLLQKAEHQEAKCGWRWACIFGEGNLAERSVEKHASVLISHTTSI